MNENKIITIEKGDAAYPTLLNNISNPPKTIYSMGDEKILNQKSVAVVGSRNMSEYGKKVTEKIVKDLTLAGVCIVSGMAVGIDSVAHKTCLENGGKTIAILGSGLRRIFPPENADLFKKIVDNGGCVISEYPENQLAQKSYFAMRNRLISGLSVATLVIEATHRSGTSITAKYALNQGKKLLCIPNSIGNKNSAGILNWMKNGAKVVTSANDILKEIGWPNKLQSIDEEQKYINKEREIEEFELNCLKSENEIVKNIYYYIKENGETNAEFLSSKFEIEIYNINVFLAILELKGLIVNTHGISYKVRDDLYV